MNFHFLLLARPNIAKGNEFNENRKLMIFVCLLSINCCIMTTAEGFFWAGMLKTSIKSKQLNEQSSKKINDYRAHSNCGSGVMLTSWLWLSVRRKKALISSVNDVTVTLLNTNQGMQNRILHTTAVLFLRLPLPWSFLIHKWRLFREVGIKLSLA